MYDLHCIICLNFDFGSTYSRDVAKAVERESVLPELKYPVSAKKNYLLYLNVVRYNINV